MNRTRVVVSLGVAQTLAWGTSYYLPAIIADTQAPDLGLAPSAVFLALSGALGLAALLGPAAGRWIDDRGGRGILAASSLVFALGLGAMALATGPWGLALAWGLIGVAMGLGLYEAAFATVTGLYGLSARGAITGITLIAGFASTVCWPISAVVEAEYGWRAVCGVWAVAHLALGLPLNLSLPRGVQPAAPGGPPAGPATRAMRLLAAVFAVMAFTSTAIAANLPQMLQDLGATPTAAVVAASLLGPAQVAARLAEFGLMRQMHPMLSARLGALAHPLGAAALAIWGAPAAIAFALMHGAGSGIITIARGSLPLALFGAAGYGFRTGVLLVPARFAQAAAPWVFALMLEHWGAGALWASAALGLLGVAGLMVLRRDMGQGGVSPP